MAEISLLDKVKMNLIGVPDEDDPLIEIYIRSAKAYAEKYQHLEDGFYEKHPMPPTTEIAVIMLASHYYESRDGSTGGFFSDTPQAGKQSQDTVDMLLRLDREWQV